MDLDELFRRLSFGELRGLSLSNEGNGSIHPDQQPMMVLYANDGLTRLHTRFLLKENSLMLEQAGYLTHYPLLKANAQSQKDPEHPTKHTFFIQDQWGQPFEQDVVRILQVWDVHGRELPLNQDDRPDSLFTPQPHILQVPQPRNGQPLSVIYQANHPKLEDGNGSQDINLPEFLYGALTSYVAYKVFSGMNTEESTAKAAEHMKMFETICIETEEEGLISSGNSTSGRRFEKRGWV